MVAQDKKNILVDSFHRRIDTLRVSLTQACNFKCVYCVPENGLPPALPSEENLTRKELVRFLTLASQMGIQHVRLTGGEPLLRTDLVEIVSDLKAEARVEDLSVTTNASLLAPKLGALRAAGLDRINISFDSTNDQRFEKVTGSKAYTSVRETVFKALEMGFPVKLNMVVLSDLSQAEILEFTKLAYQFPLEVRFLEFMPLCGKNWSPEKVMTIETVRSIIAEHFNLELESRPTGQVAQNYKLMGGKGRVGFIGSLTESFCNDCSRLRLSADGKIKPCLFSDLAVDLKNLLRGHAPDALLEEALRLAVAIKPAGNNFSENPFDKNNKPAESFFQYPLIRNIGG